MSRLMLGTICGLVYGVLSAAGMIPLEFSDKKAALAGAFLNRVYAIKEGALGHRFFGATAAISPARNHIVVENYPGELTFYDLDNGASQARLDFADDVAFVRFSLDGKKLFVLGNEQTAYTFDVDKLIAKGPPATP